MKYYRQEPEIYASELAADLATGLTGQSCKTWSEPYPRTEPGATGSSSGRRLPKVRLLLRDLMFRVESTKVVTISSNNTSDKTNLSDEVFRDRDLEIAPLLNFTDRGRFTCHVQKVEDGIPRIG